MLIDLHCHTHSIKKGEESTREVTSDVFAQKIESSGVEIVGITNHNSFDYEQFKQLQASVKDKIQVWPGVELDIGREEERYHLIVISNPAKVADFNKTVASLIGKDSPNEFNCTVEEVIEAFEPLDSIFLPHFHKNPAISESEFERVSEKLANKNRLIRETQNITSMSMAINHGMSTTVGSDIKDWNNYPGKDLPELRLGVDSYESFCRLIDKDPIFIKTLLDKKTHEQATVNPCDDEREKANEPYTFYHDINVIMGDKGTGKSRVIKSLFTHFTKQGLKVSKYFAEESKDELKKELNTDDMERKSSVIGFDNCLEEFNTVRNWTDTQPTSLSEYLEYNKSKDKQLQKKRIRWSQSKKLSNNAINTRRDKLQEDLGAANNAIVWLKDIKLDEYILPEEANILNDILKKLSDSIRHHLESAIIEQCAIKLTNDTIDSFKKHIAAKTDSYPKPDNTGFVEFAINRVALDNAVSSILEPFSFPLDKQEKREYVLMGSIGEKGKIYMESCHKLLTKKKNGSDLRWKEFEHGVITHLDKSLVSLRSISKNKLSNKKELYDSIIKLNEFLDNADASSLDDFVGISKKVVDSDHKPYELSNGERSIIFIQKALGDNEANVYLLDEPELSMANSYIDEVIRPEIIGLGRINKIVIVATHNANLAVRTLPYTTMYRYHGDKSYQTYSGNPFIDELININDNSDVISWRETSMRILEGGRDAFNDRKDIYGQEQ